MKPLLITYSTREGQARRIAEHIEEYLRAKGARAVISDVAGIAQLADFHPTDYEGVLVVASVHNRRHADSAVQFARRHADALNQLPSLFMSVSSAQILAESKGSSSALRHLGGSGAERLLEQFLSETGWHPTHAYPVAGAIAYTKYRGLVRLGFQLVAYLTGLSTDLSRDHRYSDLSAIDRYVNELLSVIDARLPQAIPAA